MRANIGEILSRRARRDPGVEAVVAPDSGSRLTFAELDARSNRLANGLAELGINRGDRVGVLMMNCPEFVEAFYGVGKLGGANVTLNWRLVADELAFMLADSGAVALIFGDDFADVANELRLRGDATAVQHWIQVGATPAEGVHAYEPLLAAASSDPPEITSGDDDLLFIMYTSGTTGLPKGVMHTHNTVLACLLTVQATVDWRPQDRYLNALPLFHVGALAPVLVTLYVGATAVLMRAFEPAATWEVIESEQITNSLLVPAMLQFMTLGEGPGDHDHSSLRWVLSGAAPVPVSLIEKYTAMGVEIHQVYGLTESCGTACVISSDDAVPRAGSTGKAFVLTDVRVVDDDGVDCPPGQPGEVLVRADHVMAGYWNRPDATAEVIVDGWLHTGDVATMDADGFVTIVDRIKDMLISGGENVYPAEIENVLLQHDRIDDVAVIGIPSERWGESPLAVVVRADEELTADEVMDFTRGRLAGFKSVKAVEFIDVIPRNASGKILKRELREAFPGAAPE